MVIGSRAIKHWYPDFKRKPNDWDHVTSLKSDEALSTRISDYHNIEPLTKYLQPDIPFASPNILLTLKVSHIRYDIKWDKHWGDILFLMEKGAKIDPELFKELENHWVGIHGDPNIISFMGFSQNISDTFKLNEVRYLSDLFGNDKRNTKGASRMFGFKKLIRMSPTWCLFFIIHNYKQILNNFKQN